LEKELRVLQTEYYSVIWHDIYNKFNSYNKEYLELEKIKFGKEKRQEGLNRELEQMKIASGQSNEFEHWQKELAALQNKKDILNRRLAKIEAQVETKLEAAGQHDLSFLFNKKEAGIKELVVIQEEINNLNNNISSDQEQNRILNLEKNKIDQEIRVLDEKMAKIEKIDESAEMKSAHDLLHKLVIDLEKVEEITDFNEIMTLTIRIKKELKEIKRIILKEGKAADDTDNSFKELQIALNGFLRAKEQSIGQINEINLRLSAKGERVKMLNEKKQSLEAELKNIEARLKQGDIKFDFKELETEQENIKKEITEIEEKIAVVKDEVNKISASEEKKRQQLFALQNDLQGLQNELNTVNNQFNPF